MGSNQDINVEEIMEQIRASVKERNIQGEKVYFDVIDQSDYDEKHMEEATCDIGDLGGSLGLLSETAELSPEWTIKSHRKVIGFFIVIFKRLIRKLSYEYMSLMAKKQSKFNKGVARSMNLMYEYMHGQADINDKVEHLEKEVSSTLYKEMVILEDRNKELETSNRRMKQEFTELKAEHEKTEREMEIMKQKMEILAIKCEKLEQRQSV